MMPSCGQPSCKLKRGFAPADDTQHAHYMCKVLLKHPGLSSFKNDYGFGVLRVIKSYIFVQA